MDKPTRLPDNFGFLVTPRASSLSLAVALAAAMLGCGGANDPYCAPAGSISASLNGHCIDFTSGSGGYTAASLSTTLGGQLVDGGTPAFANLTMFFPGFMPGTFPCGRVDADGGLLEGLTLQMPGASYGSTSDATATPCTIAISAYGTVGGHIVGNFTGTVVAIERSGSPLPPQTEVITQGAFDLVRLPDQ